jgi:hypothetical protein
MPAQNTEHAAVTASQTSFDQHTRSRLCAPPLPPRDAFLDAGVYEPAASLFPQEFGWIDGKRSQGWNGRRCKAQQRHR